MKRPVRVELPEEPPPIGRDAARVLLELLREAKGDDRTDQEAAQ